MITKVSLLFIVTVSYTKNLGDTPGDTVVINNTLASVMIYLIKYHRFITKSTFRVTVVRVANTGSRCLISEEL